MNYLMHVMLILLLGCQKEDIPIEQPKIIPGKAYVMDRSIVQCNDEYRITGIKKRISNVEYWSETYNTQSFTNFQKWINDYRIWNPGKDVLSPGDSTDWYDYLIWEPDTVKLNQ